MKKILLIALGVVVGIIGINLWRSYQAPPPEPLPQRQTVPEPAATGIRHPIAEAEPPAAPPEADLQQPLPELDESDSRVKEILSRLLAGQRLENFFVLDHFIRRLVITIDNLPRRELPLNRLPTWPVPGSFQVAEKDGSLTIDPANFGRYASYIGLAEAVDPKRTVAAYVRLYPLFQKAYEEIGYPSGYFNDRLIEVIDHLLAAPEVSGPIRLVRPKVFYLYADPDLEALSAGRRILLRIGPDNAARIKAVLRAFRRELTGAAGEGLKGRS